jgi:hypothetical protein
MKTFNFKPFLLCVALSLTCTLKVAGQEDVGPGGWSNSTPCDPQATSWNLGGNTIVPPAFWNPNLPVCATCPHPLTDVGTCNNFPFILKANNFPSVYITPGGNIGINSTNPSAALDVIEPNASSASHLRIFGDQGGNIESETSMNLNFAHGKSFFISEGTAGSSINWLSVRGGGNVGIGLNQNVNAKLGIDASAGTGEGLYIRTGGGNTHALALYNYFGTPNFLIYPDGKTHATDNVQIGFNTTAGMIDPNCRLNIDVNGTTMNGIKFTTSNDAAKVLEVQNSNYSQKNSAFIVYGNGKTQIGWNKPDPSGLSANAMLSVMGGILAHEVRISKSQGTHWNWPDFVFEKNYKLMPLSEVESYVAKNKHLPGVLSEAEVNDKGLDLAEINAQLLQKVEELYLHTIELKKQLDEQNAEIKSLKQK